MPRSNRLARRPVMSSCAAAFPAAPATTSAAASADDASRLIGFSWKSEMASPSTQREAGTSSASHYNIHAMFGAGLRQSAPTRIGLRPKFRFPNDFGMIHRARVHVAHAPRHSMPEDHRQAERRNFLASAPEWHRNGAS